MQLHRELENLPLFRKAVVTIGTFDGVHKGHQKIIAAIRERAAAIGGESVVITFFPHPRKIVSGHSLQLINTPEEKITLLEGMGIDHLVVVPFTQAFACLSAESYIGDFLVARFRPHTIVIGYDHHFGKDRKGNFSLLQQYAATFRYNLLEIPKHVLDEIAISSTKIREAILEGAVEKANALLGYPFYFTGTVVPGDRLGRKLGYPTANLEKGQDDKIQLGHGVYAVEVLVEGAKKQGMLSIGNRPTVDGLAEKTEVNIFDFNADLYGKELTVSVLHFLRKQEKYSSLEALKEQLQKDEQQSRRLLSHA